MPSRDRQSDITNALGPSWYDCRQLTAEIERDFNGRIYLQVGPSDVIHRWTYRGIHIRLEFTPIHENLHGRLYAAASMGDSGGSKTFTGAFYKALLDLWDKLEARNDEAEAPAQEELPF